MVIIPVCEKREPENPTPHTHCGGCDAAIPLSVFRSIEGKFETSCPSCSAILGLALPADQGYRRFVEQFLSQGEGSATLFIEVTIVVRRGEDVVQATLKIPSDLGERKE